MVSKLNKFLILAICFFSLSGFKLLDEGSNQNSNVQELNIVGPGVAASGSGVRGTITFGPAFSDITGSVTDAQVPNSITVDLATSASDLTCTNCIGATEIDESTLESPLESLIDLQDLQGAVTDAQVPNNITITLAATATALAADGTNCSAGSYPLGVDASGVVQNCTVATTGTVTAVSIATANGFSGTSTGSATPALTIIAGAITPTTVNSITFSGASTPALTVTGTSSISGSNTGDQTNISGNAATVTTNANLTGVITSSGNATSIASQTGTGTKFVVDNSPTLITPVLGVASATSVNSLVPVAQGSNPTTDASGKFSIDNSATTGSMWAFYGDASYRLPAYMTKSFVVTAVTASGDFGNIALFPYAVTIRAVKVLAVGGTNVVGQLDQCNSNGASCAAVDSSDITATAATTAADDGTLSNPSVAAGNWIGWHTTSVSGTNTNVNVTFYYTVDSVS